MKSIFALLIILVVSVSGIETFHKIPQSIGADLDIRILKEGNDAEHSVSEEKRWQKRDNEDQKEDVEIVNRCRAQELSPGGALGIMVVLATGSAIHMRGSIIFPRRGGFYRFAPELGIFEAMVILLTVAKSLFIHRKSLKVSVMATLMLRYFRGEDDLWWQQDGAMTAENCYEQTESMFHRIRNFGNDRLLGDGLMILAIIKAFAVRGTVRTNLLAASYGLSFFTIELLSLVALHFGPPKTRTELEATAVECTELVTLLDNSDNAWEYRTSLRWQNLGENTSRFQWTAYALAALYGFASALHLIFWPFSIPFFVLFDFVERHKGKWIFQYATFLMWSFWIAVVASGLSLVIVLPGLLLWKSPRRRERYWEICRKFLSPLITFYHDSHGMYDAYALLKFALIVRYYLSWYTGQGTTKPAWLDWLG